MRRKTNQSTSPYGRSFYANRNVATHAAAGTILDNVFAWYSIKSVCDVGCGVGTWLAAAAERGVERIVGLEGAWIAQVPLRVPVEAVFLHDLEAPLPIRERFDLVLSLEVAEHLRADRGPGFVADLAALGDLVLFAAAIPEQGGTGHVNERWQSYWAGLFGAHGFIAYDLLRPLIWNNEAIPWWYRQNLIAYARRGTPSALALGKVGPAVAEPLDLVHPELFLHAERRQPFRALKKRLRRLLGR